MILSISEECTRKKDVLSGKSRDEPDTITTLLPSIWARKTLIHHPQGWFQSEDKVKTNGKWPFVV